VFPLLNRFGPIRELGVTGLPIMTARFTGRDGRRRPG
jgi:hypothetical protein